MPHIPPAPEFSRWAGVFVLVAMFFLVTGNGYVTHVRAETYKACIEYHTSNECKAP